MVRVRIHSSASARRSGAESSATSTLTRASQTLVRTSPSVRIRTATLHALACLATTVSRRRMLIPFIRS